MIMSTRRARRARMGLPRVVAKLSAASLLLGGNTCTGYLSTIHLGRTLKLFREKELQERMERQQEQLVPVLPPVLVPSDAGAGSAADEDGQSHRPAEPGSEHEDIVIEEAGAHPSWSGEPHQGNEPSVALSTQAVPDPPSFSLVGANDASVETEYEPRDEDAVASLSSALPAMDGVVLADALPSGTSPDGMVAGMSGFVVAGEGIAAAAAVGVVAEDEGSQVRGKVHVAASLEQSPNADGDGMLGVAIGHASFTIERSDDAEDEQCACPEAPYHDESFEGEQGGYQQQRGIQQQQHQQQEQQKQQEHDDIISRAADKVVQQVDMELASEEVPEAGLEKEEREKRGKSGGTGGIELERFTMEERDYRDAEEGSEVDQVDVKSEDTEYDESEDVGEEESEEARYHESKELEFDGSDVSGEDDSLGSGDQEGQSSDDVEAEQSEEGAKEESESGLDRLVDRVGEVRHESPAEEINEVDSTDGGNEDSDELVQECERQVGQEDKSREIGRGYDVMEGYQVRRHEVMTAANPELTVPSPAESEERETPWQRGLEAALNLHEQQQSDDAWPAEENQTEQVTRMEEMNDREHLHFQEGSVTPHGSAEHGEEDAFLSDEYFDSEDLEDCSIFEDWSCEQDTAGGADFGRGKEEQEIGEGEASDSEDESYQEFLAEARETLLEQRCTLDSRVQEAAARAAEELPITQRECFENLKAFAFGDDEGGLAPEEMKALDQTAICGDRDGVIMAFLRHSKFDVRKAKESMRRCVTWRTETQADEIFSRRVSPEKMRRHRTLWPTCFHGKDRSGRPVFYDRVGQVDLAALREGSHGLDQDDMVKIFCQNMEARRRYVMTKLSREAGGPVEQMTTVFDLAGLGMRHMGKEALSYTRRISDIFQDNYSGMSCSLLVVNAPWVASKGWQVIEGFLSEDIKAKIRVLGKGESGRKQLEEYIPKDNIPDFLGGPSPAVVGPDNALWKEVDDAMAAWANGEDPFLKERELHRVARRLKRERNAADQATDASEAADGPKAEDTAVASSPRLDPNRAEGGVTEANAASGTTPASSEELASETAGESAASEEADEIGAPNGVGCLADVVGNADADLVTVTTAIDMQLDQTPVHTIMGSSLDERACDPVPEDEAMAGGSKLDRRDSASVELEGVGGPAPPTSDETAQRQMGKVALTGETPESARSRRRTRQARRRVGRGRYKSRRSMRGTHKVRGVELPKRRHVRSVSEGGIKPGNVNSEVMMRRRKKRKLVEKVELATRRNANDDGAEADTARRKPAATVDDSVASSLTPVLRNALVQGLSALLATAKIVLSVLGTMLRFVRDAFFEQIEASDEA